MDVFFFSSRRRHTRLQGDWSSDVCSSDLLVTYVSDVAAFPLESLGPLLEHHRAFPRRVNVHIVEVISPSEVRMRTWERGSGAWAVCVAGVLAGRTERSLQAHLPGGDLELNWPDDHASVFMTGPASE